MSELNTRFRERIGFPAHEPITFGSLASILELMPRNIPFENLSIIENRTREITKENLINKIFVQQEGGLCYELNTILYFFLIDQGFDAVLTRATVYNHDTRNYAPFGRTHATILLTHNEQIYLVDTGFGGNLPLKPVPLNGEIITSMNGDFRIRRVNSEYGDAILDMKLRCKDTDWKIGYAFHSGLHVADVSEFNSVQKIIAEHPESPFNTHPLITKQTELGSVTLSDTSLTIREHGNVMKEKIDSVKFRELLKQHFDR
ncbi:arylamine N-acetyltransferase [Paenibacillus sp. FJAT-26967]|uniref:arylamine N-acetyltransferase family protein n=1 Tax=Paenibacillus sp. FJAT-26967 TaxID=1729690 RepID=UPI000837C8F7|nr:arylamine N-acetyltransferase [Paenibacillus sp. FJAT-26967]